MRRAFETRFIKPYIIQQQVRCRFYHMTKKRKRKINYFKVGFSLTKKQRFSLRWETPSCNNSCKVCNINIYVRNRYIISLILLCFQHTGFIYIVYFTTVSIGGQSTGIESAAKMKK